MIKTHREPEDLQENFKFYERCFFCKKGTPYWNLCGSVAVCQGCAAKHDEPELDVDKWHSDNGLEKEQ